MKEKSQKIRKSNWKSRFEKDYPECKTKKSKKKK